MSAVFSDRPDVRLVCQVPYTFSANAEAGCSQAFLSLCQGNHYQFDTLRRAKHSSMMVLYHLHNPDAPAFACTCNHCQAEIEPGQGYRCPECQDYDLCANCKHSGVFHPHALMVSLPPPPPPPLLIRNERLLPPYSVTVLAARQLRE